MKSTQLIEYLDAVISAEKAKFIQASSISELDSRLNSLGKPGIIAKVPEQEFKLDIRHTYIRIAVGAVALILGAVGVLSSKNIANDLSQRTTMRISLLVLLIAVCCFIYAFQNYKEVKDEKKREEYLFQKRSEEHNEAVAADNARVEQELKLLPLLKAQRELLAAQSKKTASILERLYALDIISADYRNLAAVCTLRDYLSAGKCTQLDGTEGAYELFTNDVNKKGFADSLSDAVERLDAIELKQPLLHSAIADGNAVITRIQKKSDELSNSDGKAENSKLIAQLSAWSAEEANAEKLINNLR